jgi:hypothetical protein
VAALQPPLAVARSARGLWLEQMEALKKVFELSASSENLELDFE